MTPYPLAWPANFPRTEKTESGQFRATLAKAMSNVQTSLSLFAKDSKTALEGLVISSNVTLGASRPKDPGVSVWFVWGGMQVVIPVDRYNTVEANLQAIHHIIEARRVELRHGTLALVRASFSGFLALGHEDGQSWWDVLCVRRDASRQAIEMAYKRLRGQHHPDKGGDADTFNRIQKAYDQAVTAQGRAG